MTATTLVRGPVPRPVLDRIADRVAFDGRCLLWLGALNNRGYGRIGVGSALDGSRTVTYVHRVVYELLVGPIPDGMELDHVWERGCRNRHCCLPDHLEPVTTRENALRRYRAERAQAGGVNPVVHEACAR